MNRSPLRVNNDLMMIWRNYILMILLTWCQVLSTENHHQLPGIITKSLQTLRGERFIINSLYLHRAWEFYTNSTDWQTFTMMAWEQDFPAIFDKLLKQFNVSIISTGGPLRVKITKSIFTAGSIFLYQLTLSLTWSFCNLYSPLPSPSPLPPVTSSTRNHWNARASSTILTILHRVTRQHYWRGNQLSLFAIILSLQSK